ncbi:MAG: hypothetical protein IKR73_09410 [Oscillospiraceae bacterium]|nr:hypothetical protein [Oscillospiraceae bacterium]
MSRKIETEEHKKMVHHQANVKWDRTNMRSLTCRLRTEEANIFKAWCAENGTTPGTVLKEYVLGIIEGYNGYTRAKK